MHILEIPPETADKVLPFLQWNDLLRLRRVCKAMKAVVDAYIGVHTDLAPEIEIDEDEKSFKAFLEMNLPTTRIFLNNVSPEHELYKKNEDDITLFLEKFGPKVKHLRVLQVSPFFHGKEGDFIEGLVNLKSFEAGYYGCGGNVTSQAEVKEALAEMQIRALKDPRYAAGSRRSLRGLDNLGYGDDGKRLHDWLRHSYCPNNKVRDVFKKLQILKIGQQKNIVAIENIGFDLMRSILDNCRELEYMAFPFHPIMNQMMCCHEILKETLRIFRDAIKDLEGEGPQYPNLKLLDFVNYHDADDMENYFANMGFAASLVFPFITRSAVEKNMKLVNVDPYWFIARKYPTCFSGSVAILSPDHGIPVISLVNLHYAAYPLDMPNLDRIEIRGTSRCRVEATGINWREERPDWPSLKYLDITVDSKEIQVADREAEGGERGNVMMTLQTKSIFQFFFEGISRQTLVELRLNFVKKSGHMAVPNMEEIVNSCPNLKKLTLINWPGTNKALIQLFEGMRGLEEISLENCKRLGNVAFVGLDTRDPVFFKLPKLKKLSLKCLDQMPKITDLLFTMVIHHLTLTHLTLTSGSPIKSVSSAGILSLLEGRFAESIEKFEFHGWSLENVSAEDLKEMGKKFRSYEMI